jgi:hypothetical protein
MEEYRLWITVPGLQFSAEDRWEPFAEHLERRYGNLGPTFTWTDDAIVAVVSTKASDEADAVWMGIDAVTDSLHATGLGNRYPATVEVEKVEEPELQPA